MGEVVYRPRVVIERDRPPVRRAVFVDHDEDVWYGVPAALHERYGFPEGYAEDRAGTFEHILAATAACLTGTFGSALSARGIPTDGGRLTSEAWGEVEDGGGGVMVLRRITVRYRLEADPAVRETVERVLGVHARACGVARSIEDAIDIRTELELVEEPAPAAT